MDPAATPDALETALDVLNNWRSSHSFPLNTMQMGLRGRAKKITQQALIAQRLKRVSSIAQKLRRFATMNLSRMQDIGGCRAVVPTVAQVRRLRQLYKQSDLKHILVREDDYIATPKADGYRGQHLVYRYVSDKSVTYSGLQIEIQLRSRLQHLWATAVETVGTFINQPLKANVGPEGWKRFFALTSSTFAAAENTPTVPDLPAGEDLRRELNARSTELQVRETLTAFGKAVGVAEDEAEKKDVHYFLLALETEPKQLSIFGYRRDELPKATEAYLTTEKRLATLPGSQAVLVAAESLEALRRAYPNYFLDTQLFLEALETVLTQPRGQRVMKKSRKSRSRLPKFAKVRRRSKRS